MIKVVGKQNKDSQHIACFLSPILLMWLDISGHTRDLIEASSKVSPGRKAYDISSSPFKFLITTATF